MTMPLNPAVMGRTRVKFCGLTRPADVAEAVILGADAIGLVFYPPSPRSVSLEAARALRRLIPAFVATTALFVDPDPLQVQAVIDTLHPDVLQFHGNESPAFCAQFNWPYLKAFRVKPQGLPAALVEYALPFSDAAGWLFDADSHGFGGAGEVFDWQQLCGIQALASAPPLILSGGLSINNVPEAIANIRPYALDVSSGIEVLDADGRPQKGLKSTLRMQAFLQAVVKADQQRAAMITHNRFAS